MGEERVQARPLVRDQRAGHLRRERRRRRPVGRADDPDAVAPVAGRRDRVEVPGVQAGLDVEGEDPERRHERAGRELGVAVHAPAAGPRAGGVLDAGPDRATGPALAVDVGARVGRALAPGADGVTGPALARAAGPRAGGALDPEGAADPPVDEVAGGEADVRLEALDARLGEPLPDRRDVAGDLDLDAGDRLPREAPERRVADG